MSSENKSNNIEMIDTLAVKHRPLQFSEILGNTANINTIQGFLGQGKLPKTFGFFGEPGSGKCIVGDSLVTTSGGLAYISEFTDEIGFVEKTINVYTRYGVKGTSHVFKEEHADTIYIESEDGYYIEGTPEHKIMVLNETITFEWKSLSEIKFSDIIVLQTPVFNKIEQSDKTKKLGLLFALLIVEKNSDAIPELIKEYYPNKTKEELYNGNELPKDLRLPESFSIWPSFFYYYIKSTNGKFTFSNDTIAKQMQILLLNLGAFSIRHGSHLKVSFYDYSNIYGKVSTYISNLTKASKFYKYKGQILAISSIVNEILSETENPFNATYFTKVSHIINNTDKTVYDVTEPATHSFLANGMINHNTTTARILAMTVNCQNIGENIKKGKVEPCLKCPSCKLALNNAHVDIKELNAGGEQGNVESIRGLLQDIRYSPRYNTKVYIIDECLPLDTEVLLANGEVVNIKDSVGKYVLTYNIENEIVEANLVKGYNTFEKTSHTKLVLEDGTELNSSAHHKWYDSNSNTYEYAYKMYGENVLSYNIETNTCKALRIISTISEDKTETLCDITVEKNHNFFVKCGNNFILSSNCHNLTNSARQNLLKPLEEPPKNVLWILCTTDPEKLPKAALTRCIKLYFEYPTFAECKQRLWKVCKEEYPEIKGRIKPYIKTIVTNCNCQMRDSYSVLERIAAVIQKDKDITDEEIESNFVNILSNFGELTTPAIRFITHALTNHFSLPLAIPNELDTARLSEFLNTLARHGHYAATYLSYKKEGSLNKIERKKFYGINFIRFDKALEQVYDKLEKKGLSSCQILKKVVTLTSGVLDGINKNRQGLLTPEQAVLCGLSSYMEKVIKD